VGCGCVAAVTADPCECVIGAQPIPIVHLEMDGIYRNQIYWIEKAFIYKGVRVSEIMNGLNG